MIIVSWLDNDEHYDELYQMSLQTRESYIADAGCPRHVA